jgi:hypothetical protein
MMPNTQLPFNYGPIPNPKKEAIDVDPKEMSQSFLLLELRRLGGLYPDQLSWTTPDGRRLHEELYETCMDQWDHSVMTEKARRFAENLVRKLQIHDRWIRRIQCK